MTNVRIALIGAGLIGKEHLRFITEERRCELVAIADPAPAAAVAAERAGTAYFAHHAAMLDAVNPDAVIVAVPNNLHEAAALACIERRIPVLVEKPLAETIAAAARIVAAAEASNVPVLVGHHRRHSPDMRTTRKLVRDGSLGDMVAASGMWMAKKPDDYFNAEWRRKPGGGPFLINLIHEIDCLRYVLGDVDTVQALATNSVRGFAVEDTAALVMQFRSGTLATFVISDAVPSPWFWDVASGQGAYFPYDHGNCFFFGGTRASLAVPTMEMRWHADRESWQDPILQKVVPTDRSNCYTNQLRHFVDVALGRAEPLCSARDGLMTLVTTLAASQAAATQKLVHVDDLAGEASIVDREAI